MPRGRAAGSSGRGMAYNGRGFSYNFGISISSRLVNQLRLLSGQTLSLAAAMYGLSRVSGEFTDTLKKNTMYYGGQLKTIKAMRFAQEQLLKGATEFGTGDILSGMRSLMASGIDARKNFKFVSDAADATGQTFTEMSDRISQAIGGNMGGLVEMGVLTQRAARHYERYAANTVMRQQAVMNLLKSNKNLQNSMAGSFKTVSGQWRRVVEGVKMFAQSIMGNPNDPTSLYSTVRNLITKVGDWMHKHSAGIRKAGWMIGTALKWIVRQVYDFARFIGRKVGNIFDSIDKNFTAYRRKLYSFLIGLELWKWKIVDFLKEHKGALLGLLKAYGAFKGVKLLTSVFSNISSGISTALAGLTMFNNRLKTTAVNTKAVQAASAASNSMQYSPFMMPYGKNNKKFQSWLYRSKLNKPFDMHARSAQKGSEESVTSILAMQRLYEMKQKGMGNFGKKKQSAGGFLKEQGANALMFLNPKNLFKKGNFVSPFKAVWGYVSKIWGGLKGSFGTIVRIGGKATVWTAVLALVVEKFSAVKKIVGHVFSIVGGIFTRVGNLIKKIPFVGTLFSKIGKGLSNIWEGLGNWFDKAAEWAEWLDRKINPDKFKKADDQKKFSKVATDIAREKAPEQDAAILYDELEKALRRNIKFIQAAEKKYGTGTQGYNSAVKGYTANMREAIKLYAQGMQSYSRNSGDAAKKLYDQQTNGEYSRLIDDIRSKIWLIDGERPKIKMDPNNPDSEVVDPFEMFPDIQPNLNDIPKKFQKYFNDGTNQEDTFDGSSSSINVNKGAVQINIYKGDKLNEEQVAKEVERALTSINRKSRLRNGENVG